jgi:hypothetical protein
MRSDVKRLIQGRGLDNCAVLRESLEKALGASNRLSGMAPGGVYLRDPLQQNIPAQILDWPVAVTFEQALLVKPFLASESHLISLRSLHSLTP